jgi:hypothetical protein
VQNRPRTMRGLREPIRACPCVVPKTQTPRRPEIPAARVSVLTRINTRHMYQARLGIVTRFARKFRVNARCLNAYSRHDPRRTITRSPSVPCRYTTTNPEKRGSSTCLPFEQFRPGESKHDVREPLAVHGGRCCYLGISLDSLDKRNERQGRPATRPPSGASPGVLTNLH